MNITKLAEILLVEDNPGDIDLTTDAFDAAKFRNNLNIVMDGKKALDFLHKRNGFEDAPTPDIILLDLNLPIIDGIEVLKDIKSDDKLRIIPTIVLTSSESEMDIVESYDHHANSYIMKPVDALKFLEVIEKVEDFWVDLVCLPEVR